MNPLHFCILTIMLLLLFDEYIFVMEVMIVVGVIEFIHLSRCSMRIIPDELLGSIEILVFWNLFLDWVGGMGQYGFQVMFFDGTVVHISHFCNQINKFIPGI